MTDRRMRTGPVRPIVDKLMGTGEPNPNQRIGAKNESKFKWGTVLQNNPIQVVLDGETEPLPLEPESIVSRITLTPYCRVWVQLVGRRVIILGPSRQSHNWENCTLLNGLQPRPGYDPQVKMDTAGFVHLRGHMNPDKMANLIENGSNSIDILQVPEWAIPIGGSGEPRWTGYSTSYPSITYGGWIGSSGVLTFRIDTNLSAAQRAPSAHWCILCPPWEPAPIVG